MQTEQVQRDCRALHVLSLMTALLMRLGIRYMQLHGSCCDAGPQAEDSLPASSCLCMLSRKRSCLSFTVGFGVPVGDGAAVGHAESRDGAVQRAASPRRGGRVAADDRNGGCRRRRCSFLAGLHPHASRHPSLRLRVPAGPPAGLA